MRTVTEVEKPDSYVYETWHDIAAVLGVSVRSAQRYVDRRGLEVAKGPANRVWIRHGDLKAWIRAHTIILGGKAA
ncbi:MAG: helix-turn-helix domain-containing protein [Polyangiaceae bacterium]